MEQQGQAWLIRANPKNQSYVAEFLQEGFIAIGWGEVGDLTDVDYDEIKQRIIEYCPYLQEPRQQRIPLSALHHFKNSMFIGDYVLMPDTDASKIHVGQILEGYCFDGTDKLIAHRRRVLWSPSPVLRSLLSDKLRSSLKTQRTVADLSRYYKEIADLFDSDEITVQSRVTYSAEITIRGRQPINLTGVPRDITTEEAREICNIIMGFATR